MAETRIVVYTAEKIEKCMYNLDHVISVNGIENMRSIVETFDILKNDGKVQMADVASEEVTKTSTTGDKLVETFTDDDNFVPDLPPMEPELSAPIDIVEDEAEDAKAANEIEKITDAEEMEPGTDRFFDSPEVMGSRMGDVGEDIL